MAEIVLVPGFWLGAWAWDAVAQRLRDAGHHVVALTLPGLESRDADRRSIGLGDHIGAVVDVVRAAAEPVVLVGHSGAGAVIYGATDAMPEKVSCGVYVDSGPLPDGVAVAPDLPPDMVEIPLPGWAELEAEGTSVADLDDETLADFAARAVPHPAGVPREPLVLTNPARRKVPVVEFCSTFPSAEIRELAAQGMPFFAELAHLDVSYVDVPTGHYPMWSRPDQVASTIDRAARQGGVVDGAAI